MYRFLALAVLLAGCSSTKPSTPAVPLGQNVPQSFEAQRTVGYDYLLYVPETYANSDEAFPLVLFLHGAGERGDDLEKVKVHGPPKMVEDGRAFPFILASPQVPQGQIWSAETLSALLDHLEASYRVDPERIYLTGLSMGGNGSWMLGMHEPDRFAAIVPICGWGDARRVCALKDTPVWTFHGDADQVVTIDYTDRLVTNLQRCEGNIQYTVYEGVGHDSWTPTYADEAMWDWMLSQRR